MNQQAARKLAEKVIGTGSKGYLIVVFPDDRDAASLRMKDVSFATNANNDVVLVAMSLVTEMLCTGSYSQEILGEEPQLPPARVKELEE